MMAKCFFFILFLSVCCLSGCEDSGVDKPIKKPQKQQIKKLLVKDSLKTPQVVNKKITNTKNKIKKKPTQVVQKNQLIEPLPNNQVLDLSLPIEIKQPVITGSASRSKPQDYLPDFFAEKKDKIDRHIQIDGKVIEKEEEEIEKQRTVDGVGIAIKLTH